MTLEIAEKALQEILKVTGLTPLDVIAQQRGIAQRTLETLNDASSSQTDKAKIDRVLVRYFATVGYEGGRPNNVADAVLSALRRDS